MEKKESKKTKPNKNKKPKKHTPLPPKKKKEKKGKKRRTERGRNESSPVRSVCPPAPTLTGAQSGFAVSGIRYVLLEEFRKLSLPQTVCVMIWGSALCLTCQQEGSIKIWIDCAVAGEPEHFQGSLPHRRSCPSAAFNAQLHMAGALMGASSLLRCAPQFLFQLLSSDCL